MFGQQEYAVLGEDGHLDDETKGGSRNSNHSKEVRTHTSSLPFEKRGSRSIFSSQFEKQASQIVTAARLTNPSLSKVEAARMAPGSSSHLAPGISHNLSQRQGSVATREFSRYQVVQSAPSENARKSANAEAFQQEKTSDNEVKLFFKPLNKRTTKDGVQSVLSQFGSISYLRVPFSKKKNKNLGYGFVVFENPHVANSVLYSAKKIIIDDKTLQFEKFTTQRHLYKQPAFEGPQMQCHAIDRWSPQYNDSNPYDQKVWKDDLRDSETVFLQGNLTSVPNDEDHGFWCIKPTVSLYHRAQALSESRPCDKYRFNLCAGSSFENSRLIKPIGGHPSRC